MYTIYEELGGNRHFYKSAFTVREVLEAAEKYWSSRPRVCRLVVSLPDGGEKGADRIKDDIRIGHTHLYPV